MIIKYTGSSDFQEFGASDFAKADLEQRKLSFARGVEMEVDDLVGRALTSSDGIFGGHQFEEVLPQDAPEPQPDDVPEVETELKPVSVPSSRAKRR